MAVVIAMAAALSACSKSDSAGDNGDQTVAVTGVTLSQPTATLHLTDSPLTLTATVEPDSATNQTVSWTSSNSAVATVSTGGVVTPVAVGTATITATTQDGNKTATCTVTVASPLVTDDAGVVLNGVKWARSNVDAVGPEDPGRYYQWNSAVGWNATGASEGGAAWNPSWDGNGATTWAKANDPCPSGWRVPTTADLLALLNAGSTWTTGTPAGRTFGSGSNTIFLPAAGELEYWGSISDFGAFGRYWSSDSPYSAMGDYMSFYSISAPSGVTSSSCAFGYSVRCVAE